MIAAVFIVASFYLRVSATGECPTNMSGSLHVMESSCYEFVADERTWIEARSYCHSRGGRLAAVTSADLQAWISSRAESLLLGYDDVWIGLNDRDTEGSFIWDSYDGYKEATSAYTNWKSGEPNNAWFGQDCVFLDRSHDWQWNDGQCNLPVFLENMFICEYNIELSSVTSTLSTATTMASDSALTNVALSELDGTRTESINEFSSSTGAADTSTSTNEQLSVTFDIQAKAVSLTTSVAGSEKSSEVNSMAATEMGPAEGAITLAYASSSLWTSDDGSFSTKEATIEFNRSSRLSEATSATPIFYTSRTLSASVDGSLAINEATAKIDLPMRSFEAIRTMPIAYTYSSLSISDDYSVDTNATTVTIHPSTRSAEATTAILGQSSTGSASLLPETVASHGSPHETRSVTEIKAATSKTDGANIAEFVDSVLHTTPSSSRKTVSSPPNDSFASNPASSVMFTVENFSTTRPPSYTGSVITGVLTASDQPASSFSATSSTGKLTAYIATGPTSPVGSMSGTIRSSAELTIRTTQEHSSFLTSSEDTAHANAAETGRSTATHSSEVNAAFLGHSGDSIEIMHAAWSSATSSHGEANTTEKETSAAKGYGMHIYLSVGAAIALGVLSIIAVLVTRRFKQRRPRPRGIENPLYGTV